MAKIGSRQQQILDLLIENQQGLSIEELSKAIDISRTAIQQHIVCLERDQYIKKNTLNKTGGRPVWNYVLTETGVNLFPKQYAWFAELILDDLEKELGSEHFQDYMQRLGTSLSATFKPQFEGKDLNERIEGLVKTMKGLGFQASITEVSNDQQQIKACNCVYHDLAQNHQEICQFDIALMTSLLDRKVELMECMAKGDHCCLFKIGDAESD